MMMPKQVRTFFLRRVAGVAASAAALVCACATQLNAQTVTAPLSVSTFAGTAGTRSAADGTGSAAGFYGPAGLVIDGSGNLIIADSCNQLIRKITPAGAATTLAGSPISTNHPSSIGHDDGTGAAASFHMGDFQSSGAPFDPPLWANSGSNTMGIDSNGNIYVADTNNYTVRKITSGGVVTTIAGAAGVNGTSDGPGTDARFLAPGGAAVDGSGNVFVVDSGNSTVRKITPAGVVSTFAGTARSAGDADGTGAAARFKDPEGVAVDSSNNLYVTDSGNHTIRKITPGGVVTTLAGSAGVSGTADGSGSQARFKNPTGIAVDSSGNIYVADTGNHAIRKISPSGTVTTIAGNKTVSGSTNGVGTAALFNQPTGITIDSAGVIYIGDFGNNTIRRGVIQSTSSTLTITSLPPSIVQAQSTTSVTLKIAATGSPAPTYQWSKNGVAIAGATDASLTFGSITGNDAGNYTVQVTSDILTYNSATTAVSVFTQNTAVPVRIVTQPADRSVAAGQSTTFTVEAVSPTSQPLTYQWYKGGVAISGATSASYTIGSVQTDNTGIYTVTISDGANTASTTSGASLAVTGGTPGVKPTFTVQPQSQSAIAGATITLSAAATGTPTPTYQWQKDGSDIANGTNYSGATTATLTITNFGTATAGNYTVIATNSAGTTVSSTAVLAVTGAVAPAITTQPQSQTINVAGTVTFTVAASGTPAPTYAWSKNGTPLSNSSRISGATTATLTITGLTAADAGNYTVVATNVAGTATSNAATLTINSSTNRGRLTNLSINTRMSVGENITLGFVIGGANTSGTKPLLVRGDGPSLVQWYSDFLPDPALDFYNGSTKASSNNDWAGNVDVKNVGTSVGAFPLVSDSSKDAALYVPAAISGDHSIILSGGTGSGVVIGEIYDATSSDQYTETTPRLINVSVNKNVGSLTTIGFYVNGSQPLRVLIRAVGPGLSQWYSAGQYMPDPKLTLFNAQSVAIDSNDNWDATVTTPEAQSSVGAFPLSVGSKDAVMIKTLNPGAYTVEVRPSTGATGIGIIEIYEMP